MSLTGQLDVIPLEEVLRLLARSFKTGCLRIESADLHGRVYLHNGALTFATLANDDDLREQLLASKLVTEDVLRSAEVGGRPLTDSVVPGAGSQQISDFFREEVVESLYRIRKPGRGQFVFNPEMNPRYRSEQSFDVEQVVADADRRAAEWADIESVIPSLNVELRVALQAPDAEPVNLAPTTWRLIAGFAAPSTVFALAQRLGISDFKAAKDLTAMMREGLVETIQDSAPSTAPPSHLAASPLAAEPSSRYWDDSLASTPPRETADLGADLSLEPTPARAPEPEPVAAADHNQSWWQEPTDEVPVPAPAEDDEPTDDEEEAPEPDSEEKGSDSFLDRVFAQLNESPEGQGAEAPTPSHGFLKRRRMSSISADE